MFTFKIFIKTVENLCGAGGVKQFTLSSLCVYVLRLTGVRSVFWHIKHIKNKRRGNEGNEGDKMTVKLN